MTKTPATLAKQMERAMHRAGKDWACYSNEHCAVYENDLEQICPRNDIDRKRKLAEFAAQNGFRLKFYHKGLFAIFGKRPPPLANDAAALWLRTRSASPEVTESALVLSKPGISREEWRKR